MRMLVKPEQIDQVRAWAVHVFTASGIIFGFLALAAISDGKVKEAMYWLIAALIIDGVDGTLARKVGVRDVLPRFDGAVLDNIIDYFTYTVVPAYYIWSVQGTVPDYMAMPCAMLILMVSQYHFGDEGHKTHDHYFKGFPALWNLVVFLFFLLQTPALFNLITIVCLAALTFIPVKFVHPFRVTTLRPLTLILTAVCAVVCLISLYFWPYPPLWANAIIIAITVYFGILGLWRTITGSDRAHDFRLKPW